jgi:hypothetical protein
MSPNEKLLDTESIMKAIRHGVSEAIWEHKQLGNPIAIWRDGGVVVIPPEEIQVERPVPLHPHRNGNHKNGTPG